MSSDEEKGCICPFCGEDLGEFDLMWRTIHVNGCGSAQDPQSAQRSNFEECPICHYHLNHLSIDLATKHINQCMDRQAKLQSSNRSTERCPFCGQCLKDMTERQRKIHDQTCRGVSKVQEVGVFQYPKIIENLPTPEEWETERRIEPKFVEPVNDKKVQINIPIFGEVSQTEVIQHIDGLKFQNFPFILETNEAKEYF